MEAIFGNRRSLLTRFRSDKARPTNSGSESNLPTTYFYVAGLVAVLAAGVIAFSRLGGGMFFSWDSASYIAFANETLTNGIPFQLGPSYNQSLGNITFPADFLLLPEAVLSFRNGAISPVLFYLIAAALFYSCAFLGLMLFRFGPWLAFAAACLFPLLTLPYSSPVLHTELFWWHAPFWIPTVYLSFALLASYYLAGRLARVWNLVPLLLFPLAVIWTIAAFPKFAAVHLMGAGLFCAVFTLACRSWEEVGWKLGAGVLAMAAVTLSGAWNFLAGVYGYTSNSVFAQSALTETGQLDWRGVLSIFFHPPAVWYQLIPGNLVWVKYHLGYTLPALAIFGAALALFSSAWPRPVKVMAVGILLLFPFSFLSIYASIHPAQVNYFLFAFALLPLVHFLRLFEPRLERMLAALGSMLKVDRRFLALGAAALAVFVVGVGMRRIPIRYHYPPARPPIVEFLRQQLAFPAGAAFNGRYVNLLPMGIAVPPFNATTASALVQANAVLANENGNDLTFSGLMNYDVPVTLEYNRMSSPLSVVFHNFLLVENGEVDRVDYRMITSFAPRILGLIGVRYVLSQTASPRENVSLAMAQPLATRPQANLWEITDGNRGLYSPTALHFTGDVGTALQALSSETFDPQREAVIHRQVASTTLVSATDATIRRVRNGLQVDAHSPGRSFILLPFEFSRCYVIRPLNGKAPHSVERADLILTGVTFERETSFVMEFVFGPFRNSQCRSADLADTRALDLNVRTLERLRAQYPGKLQFTGFL